MNSKEIKKILENLRAESIEKVNEVFCEYLSIEPSEDRDVNMHEIMEAYRIIIQSCETIASQFDIIDDLSEG